MNETLIFFQVGLTVFFVLASHYMGQKALFACFLVHGLLANWFVLVQVPLHLGYLSAGDPFILGQTLSLLLYQETYGPKSAKTLIVFSLGFLAFFFFASLLAACYRLDPATSLPFAFTNAARIVFASIVTSYLSSRFTLFCYRMLQKKGIAHTTLTALFLTQTFDTVVFGYLGLYKKIPHLPQMIATSILLKWAFAASLPLWIFTARRLAKVKNVFSL